MSDRPEPNGFHVSLSTSIEKEDLFAVVEIVNRMTIGLAAEGYEVTTRVTPILDFFADSEEDEEEEETTENPSEGEE